MKEEVGTWLAYVLAMEPVSCKKRALELKISCPRCASRSKLNRRGFYYRSSDRRQVQRLSCGGCGRNFSRATLNRNCWQKKRFINSKLAALLASNNSMRRSALLLKINRKTVARRLPYLAEEARRAQRKYLSQFAHRPVASVEFDDLETIEHTKFKPLSVVMAVETRTRRILGFQVSEMPAKGKLVNKARRKYGARKDARPLGWEALFSELGSSVAPEASFLSDDNPHYPRYVKKYFPKATHDTIKGQRGSTQGQGELKRVYYDPLFSLNHTFAMLRANICRLIRKTWCTTKKKEALADHIAIYVHFHNSVLLPTAGI